jgi:hypothetical protein
MIHPETTFLQGEFIPNSQSSISVKDAVEKLHRRTSIDKMLQNHNELLLKFFQVLQEMEEEKKSKCCTIS